MTIEELQAQLDKVNLAIDAILTGGQEYRFNDGQLDTLVKRGDLETLNNMKQQLEQQINDLNNPGGFYVW